MKVLNQLLSGITVGVVLQQSRKKRNKLLASLEWKH